MFLAVYGVEDVGYDGDCGGEVVVVFFIMVGLIIVLLIVSNSLWVSAERVLGNLLQCAYRSHAVSISGCLVWYGINSLYYLFVW